MSPRRPPRQRRRTERSLIEHACVMNPETRRPKAERNPKPEIRSNYAFAVQQQSDAPLVSDFGFRPSLRASFGLRISAFGFLTMAEDISNPLLSLVKERGLVDDLQYEE